MKQGKYVLFLVEIPYDPSIPNRFAQRRRRVKSQQKSNTNVKGHDSENMDQMDMRWVSLDAVDRAIQEKSMFVDDPELPGEIVLHKLFVELMNVKGVLNCLYKVSRK